MPRKPFLKLLGCPSWPQAERMLLEGAGVIKVAEFIQESGDYVDVKHPSLMRTLYRYLASVVRPAEVLSPRYVDAAIEQLEDSVDVLAELQQLVTLQLARVSQGRELEEQLGLIAPTVGVEIRTAATLLLDYIKVLQSLGLEPRVPEKVLMGVLVHDERVGEKGEWVRDELSQLPSGKANAVWDHLLDVERLIAEEHRGEEGDPSGAGSDNAVGGEASSAEEVS